LAAFAFSSGMAALYRLSELAQSAGRLVAVDNSMMSPYLQRPLECGADLVIHSATKFLNGHSDVGIEHVDDLRDDLDRALDRAAALSAATT